MSDDLGRGGWGGCAGCSGVLRGAISRDVRKIIFFGICGFFARASGVKMLFGWWLCEGGWRSKCAKWCVRKSRDGLQNGGRSKGALFARFLIGDGRVRCWWRGGYGFLGGGVLLAQVRARWGKLREKTAEKDGILGSNDGKKQKKRVKSRKNRGGLC